MNRLESFLCAMPLAFMTMTAGASPETSIEMSAGTFKSTINDTLQTDSPKQQEVLDKLPEYPGGTDSLMLFIKTSVKYPAEALKNNEQGRVIVSFFVGADGSIKEPTVFRSVSPSLDAEALRVVAMMPKWIPGQKDGKNVDAKISVPIRFRLPKAAINQNQVANKEANKIERMPEFRGGKEAMFKFIKENIRYPGEAKKNKESGRVIVKFTVQADGSIRDVKVVRGVSPLLDAEACRVISIMPSWIPGMQNGKNVNVNYVLPITFNQ